MKFFKKELCKKLEKLGCVSKTDFIYPEPSDEFPFGAYYRKAFPYSSKYTGCVYAFSIYDFLSDEEYAYENCRKVLQAYWGETDMMDYERNVLATSKNQEAYIEESVDGIMKEKSDV